jgi:hypothetical protein
VRRLAALVSCLVLAACVAPAADDSRPLHLQRLAGDTEQGFRIVLEALDDEQMRVRLSAHCEPRGASYYRGPYAIPLEDQEFTAPVGRKGELSLERSYVEEGTDADEAHVTVQVEGDIAADGSAKGVARARMRMYNGQAGYFDMSCDTGELSWSAEPVPEPPVVSSLAIEGVRGLETSGPDVWASTRDDDVVRIDHAGASEAQRVSPGSTDSSHLAFVNGGLWTSTRHNKAFLAPLGMFILTEALVRTDLVTGEQTIIPPPGKTIVKEPTKRLSSLEAHNGRLWALSSDEHGLLERLDPRTGEQDEAVELSRRGGRLALDDQVVWVVREGEGITGFDPDSLDIVASFPLGEQPGSVVDVVAAPSGLWLRGNTYVTHVDTGTGSETTIEMQVADLAADEGGAWVALHNQAALRRVENGQLSRVIELPDPARSVAITPNGSVWVATEAETAVLQLRP